MPAVINMAEGAAPSTPAAGTHNLYVDTDGDWHILDDGGNDHTLATTAIELGTANVADDAITTAKIDDEAVTNAKLAQMDEATIKGRAADAGTGAVTDLTAAQLAAILADYLGGGTTDADWTNFSSLGSYWSSSGAEYPANSYLAYAPPGYRMVGGVVYVRGAVTLSNNTSSPVATLPEGYRPAYNMVFAIGIASASSKATELCYVETDGQIYIPDDNIAYTYHLDGISFVPA